LLKARSAAARAFALACSGLISTLAADADGVASSCWSSFFLPFFSFFFFDLGGMGVSSSFGSLPPSCWLLGLGVSSGPAATGFEAGFFSPTSCCPFGTLFTFTSGRPAPAVATAASGVGDRGPALEGLVERLFLGMWKVTGSRRFSTSVTLSCSITAEIGASP